MERARRAIIAAVAAGASPVVRAVAAGSAKQKVNRLCSCGMNNQTKLSGYHLRGDAYVYTKPEHLCTVHARTAASDKIKLR